MADDKARRLALRVLVGQGRHEVLGRLAQQSGDSPARQGAIAALGREGSNDAAAALQKILAAEGQPDPVRAAAFRALRRLQRKAARRARLAQEGTPA